MSGENLNEFVPITCVPHEFIGIYEINRLGHVKNLRTGKIKKNHNPSESGYPKVYLCNGNKQKSIPLHIILAKTFIDNPDNKPIVDHINHDRSDYSLSNLRWVTYSENNLNRSSTKKTEVYYEKYDLYGNYIETIKGSSLDPRYRDNINHSIKDGHSSHGYKWKRIDQVSDYINRFGEPKDSDWKVCPSLPEIECNLNGMIRNKSNKKFRSGSKSKDGYLKIKIGNHQYSIHRLIYETFTGHPIPEGFVVDHISTIRDDNRFINLKLCSQSENMLNPITTRNRSKEIELFLISGDFIKKFVSVSEASKELGVPNYIIYSSIGKGVITNFGIFAYKGEYTKLKETLKQVIHKYDYFGNLVKCYQHISDAAIETSSCQSHINISIKSGQFCSDGFYYSFGKHDFTNETDMLKEAREKFIFKYDSSWNFINRFSSLSEAERDSSCSRFIIRNSIRSSKICPDGFYYTKGPKNK